MSLSCQDATLARTMPQRRAGSPLLWLHRGQDRHRRLKSAQDMLAERVPRARGCASEGSGGEQWVAQLFRQILHSNDLVDRGPNQRELQPLGHSDIAIDNLAQVERNAEIECYVGRCRLRRAESPARFLGCGERPAASLVRRTLKTEQAKHRVADQRDDLAAMVEHRGTRSSRNSGQGGVRRLRPIAGPQVLSSGADRCTTTQR